MPENALITKYAMSGVPLAAREALSQVRRGAPFKPGFDLSADS